MRVSVERALNLRADLTKMHTKERALNTTLNPQKRAWSAYSRVISVRCILVLLFYWLTMR